ncbi:hypothetical protein U8P76_29010 (plasmid) [Rhizobium johnstonii]|nr:hypothetical protein U8P76_29010 [Rhizobium johnstonii]
MADDSQTGEQRRPFNHTIVHIFLLMLTEIGRLGGSARCDCTTGLLPSNPEPMLRILATRDEPGAEQNSIAVAAKILR